MIRRFLHSVMLLAIGWPALAAEPVPSDVPEDANLNRIAYSTLQRDPELADLNIGVRVYKNGTAVLWGSATKSEAEKALKLLKTIAGITNVVNSSDSANTPDPVVARVDEGVKKIVLPSDLPETPKVESPKIERPVIALPLSPSAPVSRHATMVEKRLDDKKPTATSLGEPVALVDAKPIDYSAIERIRRADQRFSRLTFDLRDDRVVIGGSAADSAVAWELARKVAQLIGDRNVVVSRIGR